jgi:hypothetical protein
VADLWFSLDTPVSSTNKKTDHHDITEILLKVALNTIFLTLTPEYINFRYKGMAEAPRQPGPVEQWVSRVINFSSQYDAHRYVYFFLCN